MLDKKTAYHLVQQNKQLAHKLTYLTEMINVPKLSLELKEIATTYHHTPWQNSHLGLKKKEALLKECIASLKDCQGQYHDIQALFQMNEWDSDPACIDYASTLIEELSQQLNLLECQTMFKEIDANNAYLDIKAGSGGVDAQDWAKMLMKIYMKWAEKNKFICHITSMQVAEVGIKSATLHITGAYAYGWLRLETGVHRLVRISPYNANGKRHTSFASAFVYPEVNEETDVDIKPGDLNLETFRSSGAGGQHVQKTESAVRITHIPTGISVRCQNERSQHRNKEIAMKQLYARLYAHMIHEKNKQKKVEEESKSDVSWGNQIRSYIMDKTRVKDLRTNVETTQIQSVLMGNIDEFLIEQLKKFNT